MTNIFVYYDNYHLFPCAHDDVFGLLLSPLPPPPPAQWNTARLWNIIWCNWQQ